METNETYDQAVAEILEREDLEMQKIAVALLIDNPELLLNKIRLILTVRKICELSDELENVTLIQLKDSINAVVEVFDLFGCVIVENDRRVFVDDEIRGHIQTQARWMSETLRQL